MEIVDLSELGPVAKISKLYSNAELQSFSTESAAEAQI